MSETFVLTIHNEDVCTTEPRDIGILQTNIYESDELGLGTKLLLRIELQDDSYFTLKKGF